MMITTTQRVSKMEYYMRGDLPEIYVDSGEVKVIRNSTILKANAIGSCVVVVAFQPKLAIAGMAHVMLPGQSPSIRFSAANTRYAKDAIERLLLDIEKLVPFTDDFHVFLVGGANVLGDGNESLGLSIFNSATEILQERGIVPTAVDIGGTQRRTCTLDVERGRVLFTVGDSRQMVLWEAHSTD